MIIKSLTIENFKGIKDPVTIEFKPITLLFGPNSAGKSSIVQAIHYAREILERNNVNPDKTMTGGESVNLGGFSNFVYGHNLNNPIKLRFDLNLEKNDLPFYNYDESYMFEETFVSRISSQVDTAWVSIRINWSQASNKPIVAAYEVGLNNEFFAQISATLDSRSVYLSNLNFNHPLVVEMEENEQEVVKTSMLLPWFEKALVTTEDPNIWSSENVNIGIYNFQSAIPHFNNPFNFDLDALGIDPSNFGQDWEDWDNVNMLLSTLIQGPGELVKKDLEFRYLGPLRELPTRDYKVSLSPDESRWASGIAAWDMIEHAHHSFIESVNEWLAREDRLNTGYELKIKRYKELEIGSHFWNCITSDKFLEDDILDELKNLPTKSKIILRDINLDLELSPQDIGVGISQVFPVIVAVLSSTDKLVAIEQPELHIHPALQVALGDLFISQAKSWEGKSNSCFILETHSEHLLLRFLRRIRETHDNELPPGLGFNAVTPDDLAIYYVENSQDGVKIKEMKVSEQGDSLGTWPEGFFEERHKELY